MPFRERTFKIIQLLVRKDSNRELRLCSADFQKFSSRFIQFAKIASLKNRPLPYLRGSRISITVVDNRIFRFQRSHRIWQTLMMNTTASDATNSEANAARATTTGRTVEMSGRVGGTTGPTGVHDPTTGSIGLGTDFRQTETVRR